MTSCPMRQVDEEEWNRMLGEGQPEELAAPAAPAAAAAAEAAGAEGLEGAETEQGLYDSEAALGLGAFGEGGEQGLRAAPFSPEKSH